MISSSLGNKQIKNYRNRKTHLQQLQSNTEPSNHIHRSLHIIFCLIFWYYEHYTLFPTFGTYLQSHVLHSPISIPPCILLFTLLFYIYFGSWFFYLIYLATYKWGIKYHILNSSIYLVTHCLAILEKLLLNY